MAIDAKQDIQSQMIPLLGNDLTRNLWASNTSRDQYFQNGLFWAIENPQTGKKTFSFVSRPGLQFLNSTGTPSKGIYYWDTGQNIYGVNTTSLYKGTTQIANIASAGGGATVGFAETQPSNPTQYLVVNIQSAILVVDTSDNVTLLSPTVITTVAVGSPSTVTTATAHGLTTGMFVRLRGVSGSTPNINNTSYQVTVTGPTTFTIPVNVTIGGTGGTLGGPPASTGAIVYMNGYFYIITNNGKIYNCDFNDPLNWDPTRYLTAQMYPGKWSSLVRQNNFLVAFSNLATQTFIDNANTTGSPLVNYESGAQQNGCTDPQSVAVNGSQVTWVGYTKTGQRTVFVMSGLSSPQDIGSMQVRNWLADAETVRGAYIRSGGKQLYLLGPLVGSSTPLGLTWVYDYETGLWNRWKFVPTTTNGAAFEGVAVGTPIGNAPTIYIVFSGRVYRLLDTATQDDSNSFEVIAQTQQIDFGTLSRKFLSRLRFVANQTTTSSLISVSYSDDDTQTFSTPRTVDVSTANPFLPLGGNFRRRVFKFSYTGALRQQWFGIELYFRFGNG